MFVVQLLCCQTSSCFSSLVPFNGEDRSIAYTNSPVSKAGRWCFHMCKANSERILVVCHPPHRTFHQAQRQVRCGKKFPEKNMTFSTKGIGHFFGTLQQIIVISDISPPSRTCLKSMILDPVSPRFCRGFRCHPVSQRAGVLRSGVCHHRGSPCCTVSLDQNHGKNPMQNTIVVFGMLGIFPIYPDISKNCFWPELFLLMATPLATFGSERLLRYWKVLEVFARLESSSKYDSRLPEGNYCNYSL